MIGLHLMLFTKYTSRHYAVGMKKADIERVAVRADGRMDQDRSEIWKVRVMQVVLQDNMRSTSESGNRSRCFCVFVFR